MPAAAPGPKLLRCTLLGIGAMASPRYRPAGLLIEARPLVEPAWVVEARPAVEPARLAEARAWRVMVDGGPGAVPDGPLDAWLVSDERSELRTAIRRLAGAFGLTARVEAFDRPGLTVEPLPVRHTGHPTFGYRIRVGDVMVAWAPEFLELPAWAAGADLLFAEAAGWDRPIRFARGVGGHASVLEVSRTAQAAQVRRLVFAHLGRPTIRALDAGLVVPFGEIGVEGGVYELA